MTSLKKRLLLILLALALTIASCSTPSAAQPPSADSGDVEQAPSEASASGTDSDETRLAGTPVVAPPIFYRGSGETLAVVQNIMDGPHRILFVDPDGLGSREVALPDEAMLPFPPELGMSSDGVHYAYFTGSTETGDLTLVVYSLTEERVLTEIRLLSSDYPDNFQQLADEFVATGAVPAELAWFDQKDYAQELQIAFEYGIDTLAWSPDGRYLAFSGQMDGLSSDLYVFDAQTMEVTRLTSGPGMMQRLSWSPDGRWIMHASAYVLAAGSGVTNHAASRDGTEVVSFPANVGLIEGVWLSDNLYTANDSANGPGTHDLVVLDASTGSVTSIFEGAFESYAFDPRSNTIMLQSYPFFDNDPEQGLYRIQASEPYPATLLPAPTFSTLIPLGLVEFPFSGFLEEGGLALIRSDGSTRMVDDLSWYPYPAPIENLLALRYFPRNEGMWIYDVDRDQRIDVTDNSVFRLTWKPDSGALFYVASRELHVYLLESGENITLYAWPDNSMSDIGLVWVTLP